MRVADYVADFIYRQGVKDVFMLTGAGIMHLTDGVACHKGLRAICLHHEQSASMALEAYSRTNENLGVGYFTTGPGGTNAITGLAGAWQDSVPCLFISGQVKRVEASYQAGVPGLRQFGVQELDIIPIVKSLCKYAIYLSDPNQIRYELEKAVAIAKSGRPGPVWIDIPMDVQAAKIDPEKLPSFSTSVEITSIPSTKVQDFVKLLKSAKRPTIIAGRGVRIAKALDHLRFLCQEYDIPVVTPYLAIDNFSYDDSCFIGKPGVKGDRASNYAMQNSDLILAIGTSLHVSVIGYDYKQFAREAKKTVVDIDMTSHQKKTLDFDLIIEGDAKDFLIQLEQQLKSEHIQKYSEWATLCRQWKAKYPVCLPEYSSENPINIYSFIDMLCHLSTEGDVFISDAGSAFYAVSQGIKLKKGQRYIPSSAMATMGYSMPASIGVSAALGNRRVFSVTGDGSFQQNLQEMQTILEYKLPIKTFILNNGGYLSIRNSQKNYFSRRFIGEGPESGVTFPDSLKLAQAYGMEAIRISEYSQLETSLKRVLEASGPVLCDIICPREQPIIPTVSSRINADGSMSSRPLEDMAPFLDREEFRSNLLVKEI